ncbi:MAG: DUF883 domain-containing protein [Burkholderiales bacterium]|nr:DUF883 domain-containing protein [Burkholderiales bacterium]
MGSSEQHKETLLSELTQVLKDAEDFVKHSGEQASEGYQSTKQKLESTLKNAKAEIHHMEDAVVRKSKEIAHNTDGYVRENPWKTAGIAAGVGLLIGVLIGRNKG